MVIQGFSLRVAVAAVPTFHQIKKKEKGCKLSEKERVSEIEKVCECV